VNTPVKIQSMVRVVISLGVAGLLSALVGCVANHGGDGPKTMTRPSTMPLAIDYVADPGAQPPIRIAISPDDGDVSLEAVPVVPGQDKNWVTWTSASRSFSIKFGPVDDACTELRKKFGNEKDGWNDSQAVGNQQVYKLKLNPGKGTGKKELLVGKYSVKSPAGCDEKHPGPDCLVLDPVLIVRY
jgi:hypothetical protein